MIVYLATFLFSASIAAALTPVSRWVSLKAGAVDIPDERKVHKGNIPRMGGLAIMAAFLLTIAGLLYAHEPAMERMKGGAWQVTALFCGAIVIGFTGALDDMRGLRARMKFTVQIAISVLAWFSGFRFEHIGIPFIGAEALPQWLDLPLTVLWITGIINAINLIDGLDGLAAGVTFFVSATNLVLAIRTGNEVAALFSATIAGAVIGFLLFNWNPAIVFMGDTGSMFIGYILATTSIMTNQKISTAVAMVVPIVALGVPVIDTLLSIVRRFLERRPIFSPDKDHLHHRLLRAGLNQRRAVLAIYALSIVFAVLAIAMTAARDLEASVVMLMLTVVVVGIVRFFGFFTVSSALRGVLSKNEIAVRLRPLLPEFSAKVLESGKSVQEVWYETINLCKKCDFRSVSWRTVGITPPIDASASCSEEKSEERKKVSRKGFVKAKNSVTIDKDSYLEIYVTYPASFGKINEETDTIFQLLADTVAAALRNIRVEGNWDEFELEQEQSVTENRDSQSLRNEYTRNLELDRIWNDFTAECRKQGFLGASWRTIGFKPADSRRESFDDGAERDRSVMERSIPITSLSFIEVRLEYSGKAGRKTPKEVRDRARKIIQMFGIKIRRTYNTS